MEHQPEEVGGLSCGAARGPASAVPETGRQTGSQATINSTGGR